MTNRPAADAGEKRRKSILFLVKFALIAGVIFLAVTWSWTDEHVSQPFTAGIVRATELMLRSVGLDTRANGTTLAWRGHEVAVHNGCNAVEALGILWAAVLAFPAPWRSRLLAIAAGTLAIQALNLVRVGSLVIANALTPGLFPLLHEAAWPAVIILFAVGLWMAWSLRELDRRRAERAG